MLHSWSSHCLCSELGNELLTNLGRGQKTETSLSLAKKIKIKAEELHAQTREKKPKQQQQQTSSHSGPSMHQIPRLHHCNSLSEKEPSLL